MKSRALRAIRKIKKRLHVEKGLGHVRREIGVYYDNGTARVGLRGKVEHCEAMLRPIGIGRHFGIDNGSSR